MPGAGGSVDAPVSDGRTPTRPVPATDVKEIGVNGSPLPAVNCPAIVQSLNNAAQRPSLSVPPAIPIPVVYCTCTDSRCG